MHVALKSSRYIGPGCAVTGKVRTLGNSPVLRKLGRSAKHASKKTGLCIVVLTMNMHACALAAALTLTLQDSLGVSVLVTSTFQQIPLTSYQLETSIDIQAID